MTARSCTRRAKIAVALIGLFILVVAQPAAAQAPAAAPQPSASSLLLAKQLVELKGVRNVFVPLVAGVVIKARDMFMQTNFMWANDLNAVAVIEQKQYAPRVEELVDMTARLYATQFTEQELKTLVTFYQSPLGQKVLSVEPKVMDQAMAAAGAWGDNLSQEVIGGMRDEMKKRGHDM
jgi:uncharacterized protein